MSRNLSVLQSALADRYRVERELGAGGMATVYLAHDLRHGREVAIKVLHEDLGATLGPGRFLAEIKTTARLQHPHILPLLDSGDAGGLLFYVMPYVEGETLRARLTRETQLPLDDAVRIAREVADALGFAHSHGVIHRDIKPENILLQGGHALVADFGIALAVQQAGGTRLTQTGLSLGTPQYMSPEQAMGDKTVDHRSDIYALGAVAYEMLTGDPPFTGSSVQAIVAKVLSSEPELPTTIRKTVPAHVEAAVLKALAKLPADRFTDAAQFAQALIAPIVREDASTTSTSHRARVVASPSRLWPALSAALIVVTALTSAVAYRATRADGRVYELAQYDVALPDSAPIMIEAPPALSISPRGEFAVYIAQRGETTELWYRSLVDTIARPLLGSTGAEYVAVSPDGESVAFIAGTRVRLAQLAGGPVRELGTVRRPEGISWRDNHRVLVGDQDLGLSEFDRLGGGSTQLARINCPVPVAISEKRILCYGRILDVDSDSSSPLRNGESKSALGGLGFEVIDKDYLIYTAPDGSVIGARWSPETGVVRQRKVVHTGIRTEGVYGYRQASVSASGALVYVPGTFNGLGRLVRSDGTHSPTPLPIEPLVATQFDVSPDGRRIAVVKVTADGEELWVHDMATGEGFVWARALLVRDPRWSPDGRRVVVGVVESSGSSHNIIISQDRVDSPDTLRGIALEPSHWYSESRFLASTDPNNSPQLVWVDFTDPARIRTDTVRSSLAQQRGVVSPDGRLFAYASADEIVVQMTGGTRRSTVGRGTDPLWLGPRSLVFRGPQGQWFRVNMNDDASPTSRSQPWFSDARFVDTNLRSNASTPSGEVVYVQGSAKTTSSFLRVIPRWSDQVRARVASTAR